MTADARPRRGLGVQSLLVCVFALFVFAVLARVGDAQHPFLDTDLWWHLANGRYILAHGVPSTDVYSHTAVGHVWVVHEWLADVVFYVLYQLGGLPVLAVLTAAAVTAAMVLVYRSLRLGGLGHVSAVLVAVTLFLASSPSFGARPQVINLLLTAVLCALLLAYRRAPTDRAWWLVGLFVLWANLHGGYVVGVGLLAVFTAAEALQARSPRMAALRHEGVAVLSGQALRRLWLLIPLGFLAGLLTPGTYRTVLFAFGTLSSSSIQSNIVEWSSPDFHQLYGRALMVCILLLVGGLLATRRGTVPGAGDPTYVFWAVSTLALGLTSQRHVPIFMVAGAPLLGASLSGILAAFGAKPRRLRPPSRSLARLNTALLGLVVLLTIGWTAWSLRPAAVDGAVSAVEPVAATNWLLANHPSREVFNNYGFGGWLAWKAYPQYPVFIDGRIEVYGDAVFSDYLNVEGLADNWPQLLAEHHVHTIVVTPGDRLGLVLPAQGWHLAFQDAVARVYVHG